MYLFLDRKKGEEKTMDTKQLKHIAIVEAQSRAELIKVINDAVDAYNLDLIHYSIEQGINTNKPFEEIWMAELFFTGPMVFDYDLSGGDKIMSEWSNENHSR